MIKDALSPQSILVVDRKLQRTFVPAMLCGSVLLSVSLALSEDRENVPPATADLPTATHRADFATTYPELRAAISYRIVT